jgi:thiosulfate dehydrogenase
MKLRPMGSVAGPRLLALGVTAVLGACSGKPAGQLPAASTSAPPAHPASVSHTSSAAAASSTGIAANAVRKTAFVPPAESSIPEDPYGDMVRLGRAIFTHTQENAIAYVGNGLNCSNCHLDAGRLANSAPLWAAWGMYPAYRKKNKHVNSYGERLQGCFMYSMNGKAPPLDSKELLALETYSYWMAKGAPAGTKLAGAGYPDLPRPARTPDFTRGKTVFDSHCALCHGADGQGQKVAGAYVFPPLWGPQSFNWGAGMHNVNTAAGFIKANMPFSRGGSLSDQDAWDVAMYMNGHERPQDPRFTGSVAATRKAFHDNPNSLYGTEVAGHLLGSQPLKK